MSFTLNPQDTPTPRYKLSVLNFLVSSTGPRRRLCGIFWTTRLAFPPGLARTAIRLMLGRHSFRPQYRAANHYGDSPAPSYFSTPSFLSHSLAFSFFGSSFRDFS